MQSSRIRVCTRPATTPGAKLVEQEALRRYYHSDVSNEPPSHLPDPFQGNPVPSFHRLPCAWRGVAATTAWLIIPRLTCGSRGRTVGDGVDRFLGCHVLGRSSGEKGEDARRVVDCLAKGQDGIRLNLFDECGDGDWLYSAALVLGTTAILILTEPLLLFLRLHASIGLGTMSIPFTSTRTALDPRVFSTQQAASWSRQCCVATRSSLEQTVLIAMSTVLPDPYLTFSFHRPRIRFRDLHDGQHVSGRTPSPSIPAILPRPETTHIPASFARPPPFCPPGIPAKLVHRHIVHSSSLPALSALFHDTLHSAARFTTLDDPVRWFPPKNPPSPGSLTHEGARSLGAQRPRTIWGNVGSPCRRSGVASERSDERLHRHRKCLPKPHHDTFPSDSQSQFDDIKVNDPFLSLQPIGTYKTLNWTGFDVIDVSLAPTGVKPITEPNVAVQYILSDFGGPAVLEHGRFVSIFILKRFSFGCVASSEETVVGLPLACTLTVTGKRKGKVVYTKDLSFEPTGLLVSDMVEVTLPIKTVDEVFFEQTGLLAVATSVLSCACASALFTKVELANVSESFLVLDTCVLAAQLQDNVPKTLVYLT
nr:hypothetical protein CFP56_22205 [Quercus suber]